MKKITTEKDGKNRGFFSKKTCYYYIKPGFQGSKPVLLNQGTGDFMLSCR